MAEEPGAGGTEALSVLRDIWAAGGRRSSAVVAAPSSTKVCKNMKNIGFGGLGRDAGEGAGSTAVPVDDDLRTAWRARLAREGKLAPGSTTLRDLVLGDLAPGSSGDRDG